MTIIARKTKLAKKMRDYFICITNESQSTANSKKNLEHYVLSIIYFETGPPPPPRIGRDDDDEEVCLIK